MKTETYANSPVRNCENCVHCRHEWAAGRAFDYCARHRAFCISAIRICFLCDWQPRPPRRSLRCWLWEKLFK